ncbi:hypothetical protein PLESTF_000215600 [Pleodorina starrii]|nr:hypothetical protein PLESTF_000215600 [Pleodorina starrii]
MTAATVTKFKLVDHGVTLEFMELDQALQILCMCHVELVRLMGSSANWPFPATLDGWKLSHDAIRYHMDAIFSALETAKASLVERGKALAEWQVTLLQIIVRDLYRNVHQHVHHKRHTLFPWMSTRVDLPAKMLDYDEATLLALLDRVRQLCESVSSGATASAKRAVGELHSAFLVLRTLLRQQMEREELLGLPLLRKHFTAREAAALEKKRVAAMKPHDLAWLLRPLAEAEKKETLTRLGFPLLLQKLLLLPALRRADRAALRAHRELASGERLGPALPPRRCGRDV